MPNKASLRAPMLLPCFSQVFGTKNEAQECLLLAACSALYHSTTHCFGRQPACLILFSSNRQLHISATNFRENCSGVTVLGFTNQSPSPSAPKLTPFCYKQAKLSGYKHCTDPYTSSELIHRQMYCQSDASVKHMQGLNIFESQTPEI